MHTWKVPFITSLTHGFHSTSSQIPGLDQHVVGRSLAVWPSVSKSCDAAINQLRKVILQLIIAQAIPGWIQWSCLRWDVLKCYHFKNSCTKKDHRFLVIFKLFWLFHPLGKSGKSFWQIVKPNHPMCLKIGTAKLLCEAPRFEILDEDIATLQQVFYNILSWSNPCKINQHCPDTKIFWQKVTWRLKISNSLLLSLQDTIYKTIVIPTPFHERSSKWWSFFGLKIHSHTVFVPIAAREVCCHIRILQAWRLATPRRYIVSTPSCFTT